MNLYAGTSGFSYKQWKGSFYPEDLPDKEMLHFYGGRFRSVEINNTFYRMPAVSVLQGWAAEVGGDFRFVLKAPRRITHILRLKGARDAVSYLLEVSATLARRLGPVLFQLPPDLRKDVSLLRDFLAILPPRRRAAFEFRHPSWFDEEVFDALRDRQAALCIAEAEDGPDVPVVSTADWGYLRLRNSDYRDAQLNAWLNRLRPLAWKDAFVFFKHEERGPQIAQRLMELAESPRFARQAKPVFNTGRSVAGAVGGKAG